MKTMRLLLAGSVIGAVATGGAVTGTTLARWQDQETLPSSSVQAGQLVLQLAAPGVTTAHDLNLGNVVLGAGEVRHLPFTMVDVGAGKNLRVDVSGTASTSSGLVTATVRPVASAAECTSTTTTPVSVTAVWLALDEDDTTHGCLSVRYPASALPSTQIDATVTLTLTGTQVRP